MRTPKFMLLALLALAACSKNTTPTTPAQSSLKDGWTEQIATTEKQKLVTSGETQAKAGCYIDKVKVTLTFAVYQKPAQADLDTMISLYDSCK